MSVTRTAFVFAALLALPAVADTQKKAPAAAQGEAAQKKTDIRRLLALSERVQQEVVVRRREILNMKKGSTKEIPEGYWVDLAKSITPEAFEPVIAEVYEKSYAASELHEVLQAIDTPAYRKFIQIEQTTVQKSVGSALNKYMEDPAIVLAKARAAVQGVNAQKKTDIKRYLQLTDRVNPQLESVRRGIEGKRKEGAKEVPDAVWSALAKAATPEAFETVMLEVYDKHYSAPEMRGLVKIIDSPLFKKFTQNERTNMTKSIEMALDRHMNESSKRLMQKYQAAKATAKTDAKAVDGSDTKKN